MEEIKDLNQEPYLHAQPSPAEIASMPQDERNKLLALSPEELDSQFPGFLKGDRLKIFHDPSLWMPSLDLINAMLFAGQEDFEGLQRFTYHHIEHNASVSVKDTVSGEIINHPVRIDNMITALGIVEKFYGNSKKKNW